MYGDICGKGMDKEVDSTAFFRVLVWDSPAKEQNSQPHE